MGIRLRETDGQLSRRLLAEAALTVGRATAGAAAAVLGRVRDLCNRALDDSATVQSLFDGDLLGELGIPEISGRFAAVVEAIRDGVVVTARPVRVIGGRIEGGLRIGIVPASYADLLGLAAAAYISAPSGEVIAWLDWLLRRGDAVVVVGFDSFFDLSDSERAASRTGRAIMRRGGSWHVPEQFAGFPDDNFLTRALRSDAVMSQLGMIVQEEMERRLG